MQLGKLKVDRWNHKGFFRVQSFMQTDFAGLDGEDKKASSYRQSPREEFNRDGWMEQWPTGRRHGGQEFSIQMPCSCKV